MFILTVRCRAASVLALLALSCLVPAQADEEEERSASAQLIALHEARLSSQMDGRIVELPYRVGDSFSEGDVLARFDCEHQQAELASAQARVRRRQREVKANKALQEHNAVSEVEVSVARAKLDEAQAQARQARARVRDCVLRAPFSGQVVKRHVNNYENVGGGTELIDIVSTSDLEVETLVPSLWLAGLEEGQTIRVHIDEVDRDYEAEIVRMGSRIDPVSQTVLVRARIQPDADELLPGMSGMAYFGEVD